MVTYHGVQHKVAAKSTTPAVGDATDTTAFNGEANREQTDRYVLGSPASQEIKSGQISVGGGFEKDFDGANFSAMAATLPALVIAGTEAHIALFPEGDPLPKVDFEDSKLSSWSITAGLGQVAHESVTFKSLNVTLT